MNDYPSTWCAHCGKAVRANRKGILGAISRNDPHPWYCDSDPGEDKRHLDLDTGARNLLDAVRAAPEGDVLWSTEGDAWWIARRAPVVVLQRAGDLLHIPHVDYYHGKTLLADEVVRLARRAEEEGP